MNCFKIRLLLLNVLLAQFLFSQEKEFKVSDSLKDKTYLELGLEYAKNYQLKDSTKAFVYANAYLWKSKAEKDTARMAEGYDFLVLIEKTDAVLSYMDSIIKITKNTKNLQYPSDTYLSKGRYFYQKRAFKKALDNFIDANSYARKNYNPQLIYESNYLIGVLKNRIGNHEEALSIYGACLDYVKKNVNKDTNKGDYLNVLFGLTTAFYRLQELDSASYYSNLGIKESLAIKGSDMYNYFVLSSGVIIHLQQNHIAALDSIHKALKYMEKINDKPNRAVSYYYLGKIYYETGSREKGIVFLKKLDTIFQQQKDILPETRHGYEILINHYKQNNDRKNRLLYIEKLLQVDSVLNDNYRYIQKNVTRYYDTPLLVKEKEQIINALEKQKRNSYIGILMLAAISVLALVFWLLNYIKRKAYKKRFEALLHEAQTGKNYKKDSRYKDTQIGISEDIINHILSCLDKFERKKDYLNQNITVSSLAKSFNTNSKYLSNTINLYKKKSFNAYLNELRIDYVVEKLQSDKRLKTYTISAIAREVGFGNTETFTQAFRKKTGIYPSYFIKELENQQNG